MMFAATIPALAAAAVLAGGAVVGASAPGPADPAPGASVSETQRQDSGADMHERSEHDHPDMEQMARTHEQMMAEHPEMARMHERMMSEHPEMARMHEQMMGGTGAGMMGGDAGMGMQ